MSISNKTSIHVSVFRESDVLRKCARSADSSQNPISVPDSDINCSWTNFIPLPLLQSNLDDFKVVMDDIIEDDAQIQFFSHPSEFTSSESRMGLFRRVTASLDRYGNAFEKFFGDFIFWFRFFVISVVIILALNAYCNYVATFHRSQ